MTNAKKFLALLLSVALLVSALIVPGMTVSAAVDLSTIDVWDGTTATDYAGGDGSQGNPFKVSNGAQLAKMVQEGNQKYYILTNDIYLNNVYDANGEFNPNWTSSAVNKWTPPEVRWQGNLNGNGNIIYGLYNSGVTVPLGLFFGAGRNDATVKNVISNLGIRYCYFSTSNQAAAFVAVASETYKQGVAFYNCFVDDTVSCTSNGQYAGGFTGYNSRSDDANTGIYFENCYSLANVSASNGRASKFGCGWNANITFKYCYADGALLSTARAEYLPLASGSFIDSYGTEAPGNTSKGTWNVITKAQMTGLNALDNMPALSKDVWTAVDGMTPVLTIFADKVVVPEEPEVPEVPVEDENGVWTGEVAESFADDSAGTAGDPIEIQNAGELALAITAGSGKVYKLAKDIYLNADGSTANVWNCGTGEWTGTIDGDNHIIYGLYIPSGDSVGLIAKPSRAGVTIKNLGIRKSSITGNTAGAFAGKVDDYRQVINFTNCFVDETVTVTSTDGYASGFLGSVQRQDGASYGAHFVNCYSKAVVSGGSRANSKFTAGYNGHFTFTNCYSDGSIVSAGDAKYGSLL